MSNPIQLGWAVTAAGIFRVSSDPGLRITTAALPEEEAPPLAQDINRAIDRGLATTRR